MGKFASKPVKVTTDERLAENIRNTSANNLKRDKVVKLLLYGTGECGKTTILRQLRLAYDNQLQEKTALRPNICLNVVEGVALTVLHAQQIARANAVSNLNSSLEMGVPVDPDAEINVQQVFAGVEKEIELVLGAWRQWIKRKAGSLDTANLDDDKLVAALKAIYFHADFAKTLANRNMYQIHDGWDYFAEKLFVTPGWPAWGGKAWQPDDNDLLHSRVRTTGKQTVTFNLHKAKFQVVDVGGQASERKKFFHLFSRVDAVCYVAALSDYNQFLFEEDSTNRLQESLRVWRETVNSVDFDISWFILLLNKQDVFIQKYYYQKQEIKLPFKTDVPPPLPSDEVDENCEKAMAWFQDLYLSLVKADKRHMVRVYILSAMDRPRVKRVMDLTANFLLHNGVIENI